jgi:HEAT repeat protein
MSVDDTLQDWGHERSPTGSIPKIDARVLAELANRKSENLQVRANALLNLRELRDVAGAIDGLLDGVRDSDIRIRITAVEILYGVSDDRLFEVFAELPAHGTVEMVRAAAARGLGATGRPEAIDCLAAARKGAPPYLEGNVLMALEAIEDPRATEVFAEILSEDTSLNARGYAMRVLLKRDRPRAMGLLDGWLNDRDPAKRASGVELLPALGNPQAAEMLGAATKDEALSVRLTAISFLGFVDDSRSVELLTGALKDENWEVRREAILAIRRLGEKAASSVPTLVTLFGDSAGFSAGFNPSNADLAMETLALMGPAGVEPLRKAAAERPELRPAIESLLRQIERAELRNRARGPIQ